MVATERRVLRQLSLSYSRISKELAVIEGRVGPSAQLERAQLRHMRAALRDEMSSMWLRVGNEVRSGRLQAAGAAGDLLSEAGDLFSRVGLTRDEIAALKAGMRVGATNNVDAAVKRMNGTSHIPLSERVYNTSVTVGGRLDAVINQAMLRGANASDLNRAVRQFINPRTPGGVRYAAQRLARTEINNAFHAVTVDGMKDLPFVQGVRWNLSGSHKVPDECNQYAEDTHMPDGDAGVWPNGKVPARPHPQCLCFVTAEDIGPDEFIKQFQAGQHDEWLRNRIGYEPEAVTARPVVPTKLTDAEHSAVAAYRGLLYRDVNTGLREGRIDSKWEDVVKGVDSAMSKTRLAADVQLSRGIANAGGLGPLLVPGAKLKDLAYQSTTRTSEIAETFASRADGRGGIVLMKINAKKGQSVIDIGGSEDEILLPRGTSYTVRKVSVKEEWVGTDDDREALDHYAKRKKWNDEQKREEAISDGLLRVRYDVEADLD